MVAEAQEMQLLIEQTSELQLLKVVTLNPDLHWVQTLELEAQERQLESVQAAVHETLLAESVKLEEHCEQMVVEEQDMQLASMSVQLGRHWFVLLL